MQIRASGGQMHCIGAGQCIDRGKDSLYECALSKSMGSKQVLRAESPAHNSPQHQGMHPFPAKALT